MIQSMSMRRFVVGAALLSLVTVLPTVALPAPASGAEQLCPQFGSKTTTGRVRADAVREASGLVASRSQPPILWTHNDSGGSNRVFAIDPDGSLEMTVEFGDVRMRDFEDISIGPGPGPGDYLYAADIGDNGAGRDSVWIYRFPEPEVTSGTVRIPDSEVEKFEFTYGKPGGGTWSRNAESLAVDPQTGDVVIVEKHHATRGGVSRTSLFYRLRQNQLVEGEVLVARPLAWAKTLFDARVGPPTAAEFSKDGRMLVVKNGYEVFAWIRDPGQSIFAAVRNHRVTSCLYRGAVGEAVAVAASGRSLYFIREGGDPPIERTNIEIPAYAQRCLGQDVTIFGTRGDDVIVGTSGNDVIHALSGDDVVYGRGGDDLICGAWGNDLLRGGPGDDTIHGGVGSDTLRGADGEDRLFGGGGPDLLVGGDDDDRLRGGGADDTLRGNGGFDHLHGGSGTDSCNVGSGGGTTTSC